MKKLVLALIALALASPSLAADSTNVGPVVSTYIKTLLDDANATTARATLGAIIGTNVEAWDTDLDAIAALNATNDDIIQRKAGVWTNRTLAQLKTDLALYGPGGTDVAVGDGGTGLSAGTSGGVLAFCGTSTICSSALLTQYGVLYGGGAGAAPVAIAPCTNGQTITGNTGAAPSCQDGVAISALSAISVPAQNDLLLLSDTSASNAAGKVTVAALTYRVETPATATSVTPNCDYTQTNHSNTAATGTYTFNAPGTCTAADGQVWTLRVTVTNSQTPSWNAAYAGSTDLALPTTIAAGTTYYAWRYNSTAAKWQYLAKNGVF